MANIQLYVASCVLLLSLSWRTSEALPVPAPSPGTGGQCADFYKMLLLNISNALDSIYLTDGIQSEKIEMRSTGDTVLACAPTLTQNLGCVTQRNSSFSESECLKNIKMDLLYYHEEIASYLGGPLKNGPEEIRLLSPIVEITKNLTENCFPQLDVENLPSKASKDDKKWGNDSYSNRLEMNKMMKGFHIRAITINRAIGYISSGDHRK
ncbi:interleukin-12 subunit alpha isoform X2 [Oreochromis aureus]|uniref:Interleukin-12 subunit alpha n=1 Tax=Oreochromis aureus TaxID=47969 RepID=A0A668RQT0_OREAU|nr:interleukin-12 subunit alpha isoform X2 [Oreochromis aureus]